MVGTRTSLNERVRRRCAAGVPLLRGATLIELLMVLVIMGFLAAVAVPRLGETVRRQRLDSAARRLMEDIRLARSHAIRSKINHSVVFEPGLKRYTLPGQSGLEHSTASYVVTFDQHEGRVQLVSASFGGSSELIFNRLGVPDAGGTVVLGDGVQQIVVSVSAISGRVSRTWQ